MTKEEEAEMYKAVERFTATVTVPVLHVIDDDLADQKGTGTLFDHNDRLFLVTADHIFNEFDPAALVIPSTATTVLHEIGPYKLVRTNNESVDIAVVEILAPETIARARESWHILTLKNTAMASSSGVFALCGYPSEKARRTGGLIGGSLLVAYTERLETTPLDLDEPTVEGLDLFFRYDREFLDKAGGIVDAPHLGGCSGASVWEYREPTELRFWTPEQCLKIVGVQSSFKRGQWFRAKSWSYVHEMIGQACT